MDDIKVGELYKLLYYMKKSKSLSKLSNYMYWSISKTHKRIKYYEEVVNKSLYEKDKEFLLTVEGRNLLKEIEPYYFGLNKILNKYDKIIGYDEILILEVEEEGAQFLDTTSLINKFNLGSYTKIVISEDFEDLIKYKSKELFCIKDVYLIKYKGYEGSKVYANKEGCSITQRLLKEKNHIDEYLTQSIGICNIVKKGRGIGYTFTTKTLNKADIDIVLQEKLKIKFYTYTK